MSSPAAVRSIDRERERPPGTNEEDDLHARWEHVFTLMEIRRAPEKEIVKSWAAGLEQWKKIRDRYLMYK